MDAHNFAENNTDSPADAVFNVCPNCRARMPREMRFCRACGFRLGEGLAEYVDTALLATGKGKVATADAYAPFNDSFIPPAGGSVARPAPDISGMPVGMAGVGKVKRRKRAHWMVWVILVGVIGSVTGGTILTPLALKAKRTIVTERLSSTSKVGVSSFKSDNGAMINAVTPPGAPADKAGLVGGDVIISFDGKKVTSEREMVSYISSTPVGRTVEVKFIRDGETRTTQLTTVSEAELNTLSDQFSNRPEGKGYLGIGNDLDRVQVPSLNIWGIRLGKIRTSRPADIAGLRNGDIVIEIDGTPIRTRRELETRIERAIPYSTITVIVIRGADRVEIPVKVGSNG